MKRLSCSDGEDFGQHSHAANYGQIRHSAAGYAWNEQPILGTASKEPSSFDGRAGCSATTLAITS